MVAAVLDRHRPTTSPRDDVSTVLVNIPATFQALENLKLNLNGGWLYDRPNELHWATWGASFDWSVNDRLTLIGEVFGQLGHNDRGLAAPQRSARAVRGPVQAEREHRFRRDLRPQHHRRECALDHGRAQHTFQCLWRAHGGSGANTDPEAGDPQVDNNNGSRAANASALGTEMVSSVSRVAARRVTRVLPSSIAFAGHGLRGPGAGNQHHTARNPRHRHVADQHAAHRLARQPPSRPNRRPRPRRQTDITAIDRDKVPANTQTLLPEDFDHAQSSSVPESLLQRVPSVFISDTAVNPFQPDIEYRGFVASPTLGTPQGLAVYQNGVRVNEVFGDTVNWDFIPEYAVARLDVVPNSPIFGLNALGGALSIRMKDGFSYRGAEAEMHGRLVRPPRGDGAVRRPARQSRRLHRRRRAQRQGLARPLGVAAAAALCRHRRARREFRIPPELHRRVELRSARRPRRRSKCSTGAGRASTPRRRPTRTSSTS